MKFSFKAIFCVFIFVTFQGYTQTRQDTYTLRKLSQESIQILGTARPNNVIERGDTTFTSYKGISVKFKIYFVHGPQYDNIFNPSPTGIYINKEHFLFYCRIEKSIKQYFSNTLQFYEFKYLGRRYIVVISYRENCIGEECRYRCYNIFDITNLRGIKHLSFSSLFEGSDSFGDFNNDGILDFVRVAFKAPKELPKGEAVVNYLITAYTISDLFTPIQLKNENGQPFFLYVKGDKEVKEFSVLEADWFFSLTDTMGKTIQKTSYFGESYISFDPYYRHLYDVEGVRIEKNRWSLYISELSDLESAQSRCKFIQMQNFDTFIMIDQYGGNIKFQIFVGNFLSRNLALEHKHKLASRGIRSRLFDFKKDY